jgi:hypothetical protein
MEIVINEFVVVDPGRAKLEYWSGYDKVVKAPHSDIWSKKKTPA